MDQENKQTPSEANWDTEINAALSEASEKSKRGRKSRPRSEASGASQGQSEPDFSQAELDLLYRPEIWEAVATAPFDFGLFATGHQHWNLTAEQRKGLAFSGALCARYWLPMNPKYLALVLYLSTIAKLGTVKMAQSYSIWREEAKEKEAENPADKSPVGMKAA